jgi:predicted amidophosphoribosyltransferase
MNSFDDSYLENQVFAQLLHDLGEKYDLFLLGTEKGSFIEKEIIQTSISDYSAFLRDYEIIPMYSIVLTSSMRSIEEAHNLNLSTILIFNSDESDHNQIDHKHLPDKKLDFENTRKLLIDNEHHGSFNEISVQQIVGTGYVSPIGEIQHQLFGNIKANLMYAGRYFVYADPRNYIHCLSNMIFRLKRFKPYAVEALAFCLKKNIEVTLRFFEDISLITVVPSKPEKENHLDLLLNHTKLDQYRSIIDTNLLYTVRDYAKQKQAGSFIERAMNVLDVFDSRKSISGHVLLIDDVLTSGSTATECAKVLYNHGAEKVTILPLAIMQSNSNAPTHGKIKDQFDEEYRLNFKNKDGSPFWVASDGEFLDYSKGKKLYLKQNSFEDYQYDEVPF